MKYIVAGFFGGFVVALIVVENTSFSDKEICPKSTFYLEPKHDGNGATTDWKMGEQGSMETYRKGPRRILEKSLIGGPWENQ